MRRLKQPLVEGRHVVYEAVGDGWGRACRGCEGKRWEIKGMGCGQRIFDLQYCQRRLKKDMAV